MEYQQFIIDKDYKSVYHFLKSNGVSERYTSFLRKQIGYILLDDTPVKIVEPIKEGQILKIANNDNSKSSIMPCILPLDIVYEDAYYLLINKPAGISTIPNRSHYDYNLSGGVMHYLGEGSTIRVLNRLDKDTAGIVIFAKNLIACNKIKNIEKTYYALCEGVMQSPITINSPIQTLIENGINVRKRIISPNGKPATTYVTPIMQLEGYSLIKLKLEHGRTHQIRLHLSSIGHPLLGDEIYGKKSSVIFHSALVCKEISFFHPFLNKTLNFEIDFPEDINKLIKIS